MKKKIIKETVFRPEIVEVEVFETLDGNQFKTEEEAIKYENLSNIIKIPLESNLLDNYYEVVYFENEQQIELYEQKQCGGKDDNTWGSWVSCSEKFTNLPKWIVCGYDGIDYDNGYVAHYYTVEEFKEELMKLINLVSK